MIVVPGYLFTAIFWDVTFSGVSPFLALDMGFREDECRVHKDNGPENLAAIRRISLNLLKRGPRKGDNPEKVTSHISVDALDLDKVESPGWGANRAAGTEAAAPSLSGDTNGDVNSSAEEPNRKLIGHRRKSNGPGFVFSQGRKESGHGLHAQSEYALSTDEESDAAAFVLSVGIRAIEVVLDRVAKTLPGVYAQRNRRGRESQGVESRRGAVV